MQIKKFTGKTLRNAIEQMKAEFGDDSIVLGTKVIDVIENNIEQKIFEITASMEEAEIYETEKVRNFQVKQSTSFESEMKKLTDKIYGVTPKGKKSINNISKEVNNKVQLITDEFEELKNDLISRDIDEKIAKLIIQKVSQYSPFVNKINEAEYVTSTIASMIPTSDFEIDRSKKPKVISLIGPTGVGKTTCIAKLAVISKILHNLDIGLISIDTYRLGALDQLKIFSEISNIDFLVAYEPSDLPKFIKKFKNKDIVFIDTVGRSQNNSDLLQGIKDFLNTVKVDETYLVLNSTSDYKVLFDVAQKFKVLNYNGLILSKLDEAISYGNILNLVSKIKVPIKYLTNGQVIPDDIISADSEFIANMIYTGKIN